jgi:hypothetical protein
MKKLIAFLSVILVSVAMAAGGQALFDINPVATFGVTLGVNMLMPALPAGITWLIVGTAPGGIATPFQFNMTYIPQWLCWNDAGNPLTSLRIESQEDGVIQDYVTAALPAVNGYLNQGPLPANNVMIPIANGEIRARNVTISGVTSAAGAINFNAFSDAKGNALFKLANAQILALNPTEFQDFTAIFTPTLAAGDTVQVTYRNGHVQIFNIAELTNYSAKSNEVPRIVLDNTAGRIHRAVYQAALATPAYMMSVKLL